MSQKTYQAVQASRPGVLELVERAVVEPASCEVRIRVEACGVCHSDRWTVEGNVVPISYPRVPGHEVVGRIDAVGTGVVGWTVGQRVGVGFLGGPCLQCVACRRGDFTRCSNQTWTGIHHDGGYAQMMIAKASGLVAIPESLDMVAAAPLLCAGITVHKALRRSGAVAGDTVAVQGIGGLGHLALQFARKMGFRTIAIARGTEKENAAKALGAHEYIDSEAGDAVARMQGLGGVKVLLSTIASPKAITPLMSGLATHGQVMMVGLAAESIEVSPFALVKDDIAVRGSLTGSTGETEDSLGFCGLQDIRATTETLPLTQAQRAYERMSANHARFRVVLTMQE